MMNETYEQNKLKAGFTFHIVEMVKRININPVPTKTLPWGLSIATGIIIAAFGIGTHINLTNDEPSMLRSSTGEFTILNVGEFPVDVVKVSDIPVMVNSKLNSNGLGSIVPNLQNALFMAPQAEGGIWTKKANMLTPRWALSTSVVNGKIYAIGGGDSNDKPTSTVEEYDPVTNTWKKKSDMPTPRWRLTTSVVNGKIYAIGGEQEKNVTPVIEEYDPIKDKWEKKGNIPKHGKYHFSSCTLNGKIYIIGGEPKDQVGQELEEYDPTTDTWTKKANMPTERYHLSTAVIDGKIYAFGGINNNAPWFCSVVEEYDPVTDTWIRKSDMPAERGALSVSAVNDRIYVIGGYNKVGGADHIFSEVEEYSLNSKGQSINLKGKLPTTWGKMQTVFSK